MSKRFFAREFEGRKLKRKIEQQSTMDADSDILPSLFQGHKTMACESSSKFASNSLNAYEDSSFAPKSVENSNNGGQVIIPLKKQFPCKFCDMKFPSYQALGGHQKAHRRKEVISMMNKESDINILGVSVPSYQCSTIENNLHFFGSQLHNRANMLPMSHIYVNPLPYYSHGFDNQWSFNTSLSSHRYGMMTNYSFGARVETPHRLNHRDDGIGFELKHVPSLVGDATNRAIIGHADFGGLQRNPYTKNKQV